MKQKIQIFLLFFLIIPSSCFPDENPKSEIGDLISKQYFTEARERAAYYLSKDSNNIDALMMKGNIFLLNMLINWIRIVI